MWRFRAEIIADEETFNSVQSDLNKIHSVEIIFYHVQMTYIITALGNYNDMISLKKRIRRLSRGQPQFMLSVNTVKQYYGDPPHEIPFYVSRLR